MNIFTGWSNRCFCWKTTTDGVQRTHTKTFSSVSIISASIMCAVLRFGCGCRSTVRGWGCDCCWCPSEAWWEGFGKVCKLSNESTCSETMRSSAAPSACCRAGRSVTYRRLLTCSLPSPPPAALVASGMLWRAGLWDRDSSMTSTTLAPTAARSACVFKF